VARCLPVHCGIDNVEAGWHPENMLSRWVLPLRFLVLCSLLVAWGIAANAGPAQATSPHLVDLDLSADETGCT